MGYFVPEKSLENLKLYKYQSEDRSIISNLILKPFWRKFATIFPLWMAPNLVTLSGLFFIIANVFTTLYYDPGLNTETPRWTYFSYALGIFLYQTFDACDGMHARRTGQSGPLGELFDHCIDSINTTLSLIPFASTTGMGYSNMFIVTQFSVLCNFYLSTWEEFHTHKLFLSEFSGPVEGLLILCAGFTLTGIFGPQLVWHLNIFDFTYNGKIYHVESVNLMYTFSIIALLFNIVTARKNVSEYYKDKIRKEMSDDSEATEQTNQAVIGLAPFFLYFTTVFTLVLLEPLFITLPFILSIGSTMAFVVGRIIVGHLTKQKFPMINVPMCIPTIQFALYYISTKFLTYPTEDTVYSLVWLGFGLTVGIHFMFVNEIIYDFTTYLDVYALSIKHPKKI